MPQKAKSFFLLIKKQIQSKKQSIQFNERTNHCKICNQNINDISINNLLCKESHICQSCFSEFRPVFGKFKIDRINCFYLYNYDAKIQEYLYKLKGCFDYELFPIFIERYKFYLRHKYSGFYIIPAPSYFFSDEERGFNHVEEIFSLLNLKTIICVHKIKKLKQADLSSEERKNVDQILTIDEIDLSNKKILIVDDVFTTGSTVRAMIKLIKSKNPKKIEVLVMAKTYDLDDKNRTI